MVLERFFHEGAPQNSSQRCKLSFLKRKAGGTFGKKTLLAPLPWHRRKKKDNYVFPTYVPKSYAWEYLSPSFRSAQEAFFPRVGKGGE